MSGTFYRDSLRAQRFQMLITSLFECILVSNLIERLSKATESLLGNFSFLHAKTTKLGPQWIMVKSFEVSHPSLLAESFITNTFATSLLHHLDLHWSLLSIFLALFATSKR